MTYWIICDMPILCLAIDIYMILRISLSKDDEQEMIILKRALLFATFFIAFDCMLSLLEIGPLNLPFICIYLINILYNVAGSCLALNFFRYSQEIRNRNGWRKEEEKENISHNGCNRCGFERLCSGGGNL